MDYILFKITVFSFLVVVIMLNFTSAETYYVTSTTSGHTPCLEEDVPCFNLSQYATQPNSSTYFASNIHLVFQPGNHTLQSNLYIRDKFNLTVTVATANSVSQTDVVTTVTCDESVGLVVENVPFVTIKGLVFVGCINNSLTTVERLTVQDCVLQGEGRNGSALVLNTIAMTEILRCSFSFFTGDSEILDEELGSTLEVGALVVSHCDNFTMSSSTFTSNTLHLQGHNPYGAGAAVYAVNSAITINDCTFSDNIVQSVYTLTVPRGGAVFAMYCSVTIRRSTFTNTTVPGVDLYFDEDMFGPESGNSTPSGAFTAIDSNINIVHSKFTGNIGGAVKIIRGMTYIYNGTFTSNIAGGVSANDADSVEIIDTTFNSNMRGAVSGSRNKNTLMYGNRFSSNIGETVKLYDSPSSTICNCTFENNIDIPISTQNSDTLQLVGNLDSNHVTMVTLENCRFTNNIMVGDSSVVYIQGAKVMCHSLNINNNDVFISVFAASNSEVHFMGTTSILNNSGSGGLTNYIYPLNSIVYFSGFATISNNCGPMLVIFSNVTFAGNTTFMNNSLDNDHCNGTEGGAILGFQSEIVFTGETVLHYNVGIQGGAISLRECKFYTYGDLIIADNTAIVSGGGIYAYQSELTFIGNARLVGNEVFGEGGGIHAVSSATRLISNSNNSHPGSTLEFYDNQAERGGGMCLEQYSKLYLIKPKFEDITTYHRDTWLELNFVHNSADYGGALCVLEDKNSGVCNVFPYDDFFIASTGECFLQVLAAYNIFPTDPSNYNLLNTFFYNNSARIAGDTLYGGLLDRCLLSPFSEYFHKYSESHLSSVMPYLFNTTNIDPQLFSTQIASDAVRVCFCKDDIPDCDYEPPIVRVKKGETFILSLAAVDHVNNTISNAIIHASVSLQGLLFRGQAVQKTNANESMMCTKLNYNVLSSEDSEQLKVYAEGPCVGAGISSRSVTVSITPCPIGFNDTGQSCECDPDIHPRYVSGCFINNETLQRKDNAWFSYVNNSDRNVYVFHQQCPFDYCHPPTTIAYINLNIPKGSDELCEFNRSGILCGSCKEGFSLSLGSSRCRTCSNHWLAMIIVFTIAGVLLVGVLIKCNLTVADGLINGLIFYANVIAANRTTFLPFERASVLTILVSWVNLDFGFETCFFDGMDGYAKVWLQLAFPIYVISLVVVIIIVSDYSSKFAHLFGRNPIATLATLILLSYAKLIRVIIAVFSSATLEYSDGSQKVVWLVDGNVPYLKGKHIPLFLVALGILLIGILYTFLLFFWQWLQMLDDKAKRNDITFGEDSHTPFAWLVSNTKVIAFMEAYQFPYNKSHRYWVGLLLLARVFLYLVSAVNVLGDARINLLSINSVIIGLLFFEYLAVHRERLHKRWLTNIIENVFILNLVAFTCVTLYFTNDKESSQAIAAYVSIGVALVTFLVILINQIVQYFKRNLKRVKRMEEAGDGSSQDKDILFSLMYHVYTSIQQRRKGTVHKTSLRAFRHSDGIKDKPTITEVDEPIIMDSITSVQYIASVEMEEVGGQGT